MWDNLLASNKYYFARMSRARVRVTIVRDSCAELLSWFRVNKFFEFQWNSLTNYNRWTIILYCTNELWAWEFNWWLKAIIISLLDPDPSRNPIAWHKTAAIKTPPLKGITANITIYANPARIPWNPVFEKPLRHGWTPVW